MKDLTQGSVTKHLLHMSAFMAVSMFVQTLYLLADLYWVGHLGKEAIAAVGVAGNLTMIVLALTQMLGVGTTTLISHAAGQKDQHRAELVFNQSFIMSILVAIGLGVFGFLLRDLYCNSLSADTATATLAKSYLNWFLPALLLQFPLVALGSALRATGIIKPTVILQVLSVVLNMVLAPVLVFGTEPWPIFDVIRRILATFVSIPRLGVPGAALASFIAILVADILMVIYFEKKYRYLRFRFPLFRPQTKIWGKMLHIGVPAGAEFVLLFVYITIVYGIIRGFGPAAQAGFGIGARVMQALFLPVVALAFAVSPVVGQNFGGRRADRVRQTIYSAIGIATVMMLVLALLAHFLPRPMIRAFSNDPHVIDFGGDYLRIVSLNFVAAGIVFTTSSIFQGIGNTWPPLFSSMTRLLLFVVPALLVAHTPGFEIRHVWYLSVASQVLQAIFNLLLLRRELRKKLKFEGLDDLMPGGATAT
jgi:putative MATE family efflux protein